ncbi:MAG: protein tyrosine phosphatase family protein [Vicinamibacteria bacterium]
MRAPLLAALLASALPTQAGEIPATLAAAELPAYVRVSPRLATGAQPTPETLARLKELGFRTVINIRAADEPGVLAEADIVRSQGLAYHLIPVTPSSFGALQVDAIAKILDDPKAAPVLFHCSSSNRVGGVLAVLEVRRGRSCEQAEAVGRSLGLKSPDMVQAVRRVSKCGP